MQTEPHKPPAASSLGRPDRAAPVSAPYPVRTQTADTLAIVKAAAIWVAVAAAAFLLWRLRDALLIAFGAALAAIFLKVVAEQITRWTRLAQGLALTAAVLLVFALAGVTVWLFGSRVGAEFGQVLERAQTGLEQLRTQLGAGTFGHIGQMVEQQGASMFGSLIGPLFSIGTEAVAGAIVLVIAGIYLAAEPGLYRGGVVQLFPPRLRPWADERLILLGVTLREWLFGQLTLMLIVGVLSLAAVWLIGLPGPFALGLIAGITEMIPYVGPFLGAIPAVLVAFTQGLWPAVWTVGAYLLVHIIEGYLLGPLVARYFVRIPPALTLIGLVAVEMLFGTVGLLFAAPITVAIYMAVKLFYVRDTLKQPTEVPDPG